MGVDQRPKCNALAPAAPKMALFGAAYSLSGSLSWTAGRLLRFGLGAGGV
jgi:hypothetical protein